MMNQLIKEYFTFNRREQRGLLVLLSILLFLIGVLTWLKRNPPIEHYDFTAFENEIAQLELNSNEKNQNLIDAFENYKNEAESKLVDRFYFDPNNLLEEDWEKLGLSKKQIRVIENYKIKGGRFYKKDDLKKIYGISEEFYLSVEPYIQIQQAESSQLPSSGQIHDRNKIVESKLELNLADSLQLELLKGIGPVLAKRIIKFRSKLGGFFSSSQLSEVYGIDSTNYSIIAGQVKVDGSMVKKIKINEANFSELKSHPYFNYKTVNLILNYRNKHGDYNTLDNVQRAMFMDDSTFAKLEPYLTIN